MVVFVAFSTSIRVTIEFIRFCPRLSMIGENEVFELQSGELPIGFGIGKGDVHWERVLSGALASKNNLKLDQKYYPDAEILSIEEAAGILKCSVDRIRRIPRSELPARTGPGRGLLYLRADLIVYVKGKPSCNRRNSGLSPSDRDIVCVDDLDAKIEFDVQSARTTINAQVV